MTDTLLICSVWDLIGDEGQFRILGGRAIYSDVMSYDGTAVRLCRLEARDGRIHQINRYVDPETPIEVIRNYSAEYAEEQEEKLDALRVMYG